MIRLIAFVIVLIIGIWIGGWYYSQAMFIKEMTSQPLADIFSSVNALFAGLAFGGVIITVYLQIGEMQDTRSELKKTADANTQVAQATVHLARQSDERSVLDLFQVYCSDYFQGVKDASMSVLIPCVASSDYLDFVVSRFFVADQQKLPATCWEKISKVTYSKSYDEFVKEEQRNRYKLDELINFFTLLTGRNNSTEVIRRCDFSYSWWRPLFWMIAMEQQKRYEQNPMVRLYATPLYFPSVVRDLDVAYGFQPFTNAREAWEFITSHPKVQAYGLDPAHLLRLQNEKA